MPERIFHINEEYITLGQILKVLGLIGTGGEARWYLSENTVTVNREAEARRGRKLRNGDLVVLPGHGPLRISSGYGAGSAPEDESGIR